MLHHFGANNSFRISTYGQSFHKPFRMRTYKKQGGGGSKRIITLNGSQNNPCGWLSQGRSIRSHRRRLFLRLCYSSAREPAAWHWPPTDFSDLQRSTT